MAGYLASLQLQEPCLKRKPLGNNREIAPAAPIGAEIAAARRDLLLAARHTATSAISAASTTSPQHGAARTTGLTPDQSTVTSEDSSHLSGWLAPRSSSAARSRQDLQAAEADGILRASLSRLDARVRSLESQGVRTDRRAAELAGLAQALTEEQRALLIRLDRLEEQFRAAGAGRASLEIRGDVQNGSDEASQRFDRLEQEQRMVSTNLRLVMGHVDEIDQRQLQRLQSLEEQLQQPLKAIPTCPTLEEAQNKAATMSGDALRLQLSAAENKTALSLKSAQDLLVRCSGGPSTAAGQENVENVDPCTLHSHDDAVCDLQKRLGELACNLAPRAEKVESKVQELTDAVKSLQGQTLEHMESRMQALTNTMEVVRKQSQDGNVAFEELRRCMLSLTTSEQVVELSRSNEVTSTSRRVDTHEARLEELSAKLERIPAHDHATTQKRVETHETRLEELSTRVERLPTLEQVLGACRDSGNEHLVCVRNLQGRVDELAGEVCRSEPQVSEKLESHDTHIKSLQIRLDDMHVTQVKVEQLQAEAAKDEMLLMERHLKEHSRAISDLRGQLLEAPTMQQIVEMKALLDGQHSRLEAFSTRDLPANARSACPVEAPQPEALVVQPTTEQLLDMQNIIELQHARLEALGKEVVAVGITAADSVSQVRSDLREALAAQREQLVLENKHAAGKDADLHAIVQSHVEAVVQSHTEAISETHSSTDACSADHALGRCDKTLLQTHSEDIAELQARMQAFSDRGGAENSFVGRASLEVDEVANPELELSSVLGRVCSQFGMLQEKMEDRVLVSIAQVEQQLPDALRQLDRLSAGHTEHAARVEEHEVRLSLAITRQAAVEQKSQECMDRLEQLPSTSRIRALCNEALTSRLAESDLEPKLEGFSKRLELTMDAVMELGEKVHRCQLWRDPCPARLVSADSDMATA